jgi:glycosyltransferase involved in cell wall biosynthesis
MKILFFSPYFYPYTSGITIYPFKIFSHLAKKHRVTVLTFKHDKKLKDREWINKMKIVRMPYLFGVYKGFISPQSLTYFFKEAKRNDLIFVNLPNVEGIFLVILGKLFNKKIYSIFHCYLGKSKKFLVTIINSLANKIVDWQLLFSDKVIAYTKDYTDQFPIFKKIKNKIEIILPPIIKYPVSKKKLKKFLKLKEKNIWIGFAGRVSNEKGIEYLIDALTKIKTKIKNIKLVFAGPYGKDVAGENQYYKKILNLLKKNKIEFIFFGNLQKDELAAFYRAIDLLVLPSINSTEGFGMVQAEAMLYGTPVIASDLPGVRVPIKLTKMGIIVKPESGKLIADAIVEIFKNRKKYTNKKLIKNAKEIFSIKKAYQFYDHLLKNLKNETVNKNK